MADQYSRPLNTRMVVRSINPPADEHAEEYTRIPPAQYIPLDSERAADAVDPVEASRVGEYPLMPMNQLEANPQYFQQLYGATPNISFSAPTEWNGYAAWDSSHGEMFDTNAQTWNPQVSQRGDRPRPSTYPEMVNEAREGYMNQTLGSISDNVMADYVPTTSVAASEAMYYTSNQQSLPVQHARGGDNRSHNRIILPKQPDESRPSFSTRSSSSSIPQNDRTTAGKSRSYSTASSGSHRAHYATEKKYREGVSDKFEALRACLVAAQRYPASSGSDTGPVVEREGGKISGHRMNKASVLGEAVAFIEELLEENRQLKEQNKSLTHRLNRRRQGQGDRAHAPSETRTVP